MKIRWTIWLFVGVAAVGYLSQSFLGGGSARPGETVRPQLVQEVNWRAGEATTLFVEVVAGDSGGQIRRLGFLPSRVNPIADVQFFDSAGEKIGADSVELSHRC